MATTAEDWSIYWRVPVAYGHDSEDDDYDMIMVRDGHVLAMGYDAVTSSWKTIKVDSNGKALLIAGKDTETIVKQLNKKWNYIASDTLLKSSDSQESFAGAMHKVKEFTFNPTNDIGINEAGFRFKWKGQRHAEYVFFFWIYKNGVLWGSEKQTSQGSDWQQFSEDLTGASPGDTFELWAYPSGGIGTGYLKDYRCYGDTEIVYYLEPTWS